MYATLRTIALGAAFAVTASVASAVTIAPTFTDPLAPGDSTQANAIAGGFEDFGATSLGFTVSDDLVADVSITVNPFTVSPDGTPSNDIALSYSINGDTAIDLAITSAGATGSSGINDLALMSGDLLTFFVTGTAGQGGNTVSFNVDTRAPDPVPLPAAGVMLLTAMGGFAAMRRRRQKMN